MRPCLPSRGSPSSASCVSLHFNQQIQLLLNRSALKMKVSSSITSSSVRTVGSFKKVSNIRTSAKPMGSLASGQLFFARSAIASPCAWLRSAFSTHILLLLTFQLLIRQSHHPVHPTMSYPRASASSTTASP